MGDEILETREDYIKTLAKEKVISVEYSSIGKTEVNKAVFIGYEVLGKWLWENFENICVLNIIKSDKE